MPLLFVFNLNYNKTIGKIIMEKRYLHQGMNYAYENKEKLDNLSSDDIKVFFDGTNILDGLSNLSQALKEIDNNIEKIIILDSKNDFPTVGKQNVVYFSIEEKLFYVYDKGRYVSVLCVELGEQEGQAFPGEKGFELSKKVQELYDTREESYNHVFNENDNRAKENDYVIISRDISKEIYDISNQKKETQISSFSLSNASNPPTSSELNFSSNSTNNSSSSFNLNSNSSTSTNTSTSNNNFVLS